MTDGKGAARGDAKGRKRRVQHNASRRFRGFRGPVDETTDYDYKRVNPLPLLAQSSPKRPRGEVPTLRCGQLRVRLPSLASREAARDALRPCPFFLGPRRPGNTPRIRVVRLSFVLKLKPVTLAGPAAYPPSGPSQITTMIHTILNTTAFVYGARESETDMGVSHRSKQTDHASVPEPASLFSY